MKVLSLEAGGEQAAICALEVGAGAAFPRAVVVMERARRLSQEWPRALQNALQQAGWTLDDVDGLCVGVGPGSWTGLRIAVTAWKTLAQSREIPLAGVPGFDALAQAAWRQNLEAEGADKDDLDDAGADGRRLILVCAPCRAGELYAKIFEADSDSLWPAQDEWIEREPAVLNALATQALARGIEAPPLIVGAPSSLQELLIQASDAAILVRVPIEMACIEVALAGALRIQSGEEDDALSLQPLYLALSAAERNLRR